MHRTFVPLLVILGLLASSCSDSGSGDDAGFTPSDVRVLDDTNPNDADAGDGADDAGDDVDAQDAEDLDADLDTDEPDADNDPDLPGLLDSFEVVEDAILGGPCETGDAGPCEGLYDCVQQVCTLDPVGRAFVEQSYRIREPEEVSHVFDFIKTFAADVAFFMLEIPDLGDPTRRPARYGTADRIVEPSTLNVAYRWQFPNVDRLLLSPARGESGLQGNAWISNPFQWNLEAHIVLPDLRVDEIIGFVGELAQVYIEFDEDFLAGEGIFRGVITRREAETRFFDSSAFEPFRTIICRVHPDLVPPGERWSLADILDCNATPMDVDLNGDGILDGYDTIVDFLVEPAVVLED